MPRAPQPELELELLQAYHAAGKACWVSVYAAVSMRACHDVQFVKSFVAAAGLPKLPKVVEGQAVTLNLPAVNLAMPILAEK